MFLTESEILDFNDIVQLMYSKNSRIDLSELSTGIVKIKGYLTNYRISFKQSHYIKAFICDQYYNITIVQKKFPKKLYIIPSANLRKILPTKIKITNNIGFILSVMNILLNDKHDKGWGDSDNISKQIKLIKYDEC